MCIINRRVPGDLYLEGITFHPGNQFVADQAYYSKLEKNEAFKAQLKARLMSVVVPPEKIEDDLLKPGKDGKMPKVKQCLAETVAALGEDKAIEIIQDTIDAIDLKEIIKLETGNRRNVAAAAEKQIQDRQTSLDGRAPRLPQSNPGHIEFGGSEGTFRE
jgi:hypothetical protein